MNSLLIDFDLSVFLFLWLDLFVAAGLYFFLQTKGYIAQPVRQTQQARRSGHVVKKQNNQRVATSVWHDIVKAVKPLTREEQQKMIAWTESTARKRGKLHCKRDLIRAFIEAPDPFVERVLREMGLLAPIPAPIINFATVTVS